MSAPFAQLPGAVLSPAGNAVQHFGSPLREGRKFEQGVAVIARGDLAVLEISGVDRLSWLNSLTSQALSTLSPGQTAETLLLSPQGKIEHQALVADTGNELLLLVTAERAQEFFEFLQRMRFTLRVEVSDRSAQLRVIECTAALGEAPTILESVFEAVAASGRLLRDPWSAPAPGGVQYAASPHPSAQMSQAVFAVLDAEQFATVRAACESGAVAVAGLSACEAFEVASWRPVMADFDERALPHEFDLLRSAVHLNKGCYRGQETVAKVHNLGHPPRRIAQLHIDGSGGELPPAGALIFEQPPAAGVKPVGRITRAVLHHELGPIALALLKRSARSEGQLFVQLPDENVLAASCETIVPADAGGVNALSAEQRRQFREVG